MNLLHFPLLSHYHHLLVIEVISYPSNKTRNTIVGLIAGGASALFIIIVSALYLFTFNQNRWVNFTSEFKLSVTATICISSGIGCIVLVSLWAQNKNDETTKQFGYLGIPSWDTNILAWHPVLMVGGFLFCQIVAICAWGVFGSRSLAKLVHVTFQFGGLVSMVIGLIAIIRYKNVITNPPSPSLTTVHSWLGVMNIAVFALNFLFGCFMGCLKACFEDPPLIAKAINLKRIHQALGFSALGFTILSIETGIMDQLGQGSCNYLYDSTITFGADVNPSDNYSQLPDACKIANGLGVIVAISGVFVVLAMSLRPPPDDVSKVNALDLPGIVSVAVRTI